MDNGFSRDILRKTAIAYKRPQELIERLDQYAAKLIADSLPVIFSPLHLSLLMGIEEGHFNTVLNKRQSYYKHFRIKKRRGGFRYISAPKNDLLNYQYWIKEFILDNLSFPDYLTSYRKGISIAQNAFPHQGKELIIKFDLKDFFDHITQDKVFGMFKILGFNESVAIDLARICCVESVQRYGKSYRKNAVIPQGAPTSPTISNFLASRMDIRLNGYALKNGFSYTRYADDLTFSGPVSKKLKKSVIENIIKKEGFLVNNKKTTYVTSSNNQLVTGINVNHHACVPKKFRKNIHTHLHNCLRFGPYANLERLHSSDKINYNGWLLGNIHYISTHHLVEGKKMLKKFEKINWL